MSETNPSCSRGDQLRDVGMAIAAARRPDQVTLGRLAMVRAMLASPAGTATIDDATKPYEMSVGYADGGQWRGTVTRSLVRDGFATIIGTTRSARPSRHRGYISVMQLLDRTIAQNYLDSMSASLAGNDVTPSAATDEVTNTTSETSHL